MKKWYLSKTLWVNGIALLALILQLSTGKELLDPTAQAVIVSFLNVVLRLVTTEELTK